MVMRLHEDDFASGTERGVGPDWPIDYADLRPYAAAAERELGVAGASDNPYAPPRAEEPHPMPAFEPSYSDSLFAEACEELEIDMHSVPNARATRRRTTGGPRASATVPASPSVRRARSTTRRSTSSARRRRGATVIDRAPVQRLEHDADRITAAVYATPDGEEYRQEADAFVVACGGVETPRLLLLCSRSRTRTPTGWRTPAGVGKFFMDHLFAGVGGTLDEPTRQNHVGFYTSACDQFYDEADEGRPRSSWSFSTTLAPRRSRRR